MSTLSLLVSYLGLGLNLLGLFGLVLAFVFQPKKDPRFEGGKLIYRS